MIGKMTIDCELLLSNAWNWHFSFLDRFYVCDTYSQYKNLLKERKKWYSEVMSQLRHITEGRQNIAYELNIIHGCSDITTYYPDNLLPEELDKWKQSDKFSK